MMSAKAPMAKFRVNGREMMRVQGVYMYLLNRTGQVGAIMGFFPMVIVMFEDPSDMDPVKGYLRVDRWIYPLARSFSPIYIWGPDRLIMPEPFSSLTEPTYVVIRIPFGMSKYQKDTLWNLLDTNAHVCGNFADYTEEQLLRMDKKFTLTELTPHESQILNKAQDGVCPPGTRDLPSLSLHTMKHKLLAFEQNEGRRSVAFGPVNERKCTTVMSSKESDNPKLDGKSKRPQVLFQQNTAECHASLATSDVQAKPNTVAGNQAELVTLPAIRGNLMRLYILGPRDPQHIQISVVLEWIPVIESVLQAVNLVFKQQVRLRAEKEKHGIPPSFEGRKKRLVGGWGGAKALNSFGIAHSMEENKEEPRSDLPAPDSVSKMLLRDAVGLQNLEAASAVFDWATENCKLELISVSPTAAGVDQTSPTRWQGALICLPFVVRLRKLACTFTTLMSLSATIPGDLVYEKHTNYLERIHEDCEHHYPKMRPRNPLLDPQFPYPREPSPYTLN